MAGKKTGAERGRCVPLRRRLRNNHPHRIGGTLTTNSIEGIGSTRAARPACSAQLQLATQEDQSNKIKGKGERWKSRCSMPPVEYQGNRLTVHCFDACSTVKVSPATENRWSPHSALFIESLELLKDEESGLQLTRCMYACATGRREWSVRIMHAAAWFAPCS